MEDEHADYQTTTTTCVLMWTKFWVFPLFLVSHPDLKKILRVLLVKFYNKKDNFASAGFELGSS